MSLERWQQIGRIFKGALERAGQGRASYLQQECAGDNELRREVEALLSSNEQAGSFIEGMPSTVAGLTEPASAVGSTLHHAADPFLGRVVSNYRLEERLAAGGMGVLYRATDLRLGRSVAVKVLSRQLAPDETAKARFLREARAAGALDHPNIGAIYHIEEQDGELFIVMALYQGETLKQRLQKGPLRVSEALELLRQVALGLDAAHRAGIVHRDIKPANLLRTDEGVVKILDFGLAKLTSESQATAVTRTGETMGTVLYMSPEQLRGAAVDGRSDLWSFGVVAYELLAGVSPFQADSGAATVGRILSEEPPALVSVPGVPDWLAELVTQLLRKLPAERVQSASEVLARLDRPSSPIRSRTKLRRASFALA
ncbi:MAG TPA: serine/threonine-protein kinase, partial [Myxococcaceae bacterium]|nr:serine/threonine-protein kinase [Myxococcaceae bacterium]